MRHRTISFSPLVRNSLADRLIEGQRIYVSGIIGYTEFQSADGKRKNSGCIVANEVFLCQDDDANSGRFKQLVPRTLFD